MQMSMTPEEIETLKFTEIGLGGPYPFHYRHVEVNHPAINVNGLTMINGEYFKKEYDRQLSPIAAENKKSFPSIFSFPKII